MITLTQMAVNVLTCADGRAGHHPVARCPARVSLAPCRRQSSALTTIVGGYTPKARKNDEKSVNSGPKLLRDPTEVSNTTGAATWV